MGRKHGFFPDIDAALEWCEDRLIAEESADQGCEKAVVPLEAMDMLAGFDANEIGLLRSIVELTYYARGEVIVREGDPADSLFLLAAGLVNVCLRLGDGTRQKRLATIAPGVAFGELAVFDGGTRSADVVAVLPAVCYILPLAKFDELAALHRGMRTKLLSNIGRELSARLRRSECRDSFAGGVRKSVSSTRDLSDPHVIFGFPFYFILQPRYAAPIPSHPVFCQTAKNT